MRLGQVESASGAGIIHNAHTRGFPGDVRASNLRFSRLLTALILLFFPGGALVRADAPSLPICSTLAPLNLVDTSNFPTDLPIQTAENLKSYVEREKKLGRPVPNTLSYFPTELRAGAGLATDVVLLPAHFTLIYPVPECFEFCEGVAVVGAGGSPEFVPFTYRGTIVTERYTTPNTNKKNLVSSKRAFRGFEVLSQDRRELLAFQDIWEGNDAAWGRFGHGRRDRAPGVRWVKTEILRTSTSELPDASTLNSLDRTYSKTIWSIRNLSCLTHDLRTGDTYYRDDFSSFAINHRS